MTTYPLTSFSEYEFDSVLMEKDIIDDELKDRYADTLILGDMVHRGMNEILYMNKFPVSAQEGLLGTVYDFIVTIIRNVARFIEKVINWFTTKIKSIVNVRLKVKKHNDALYDQYKSLWNGLSGVQKTKAVSLFRELQIDNTPSFDRFSYMCQKFDAVTTYINTVVDQYTTQEVALFGAQTEIKLHPDWLKPELIAMLTEAFNVRFVDGTFEYDSPFKLMATNTLDGLGYATLDTVSIVHKNYTELVFRNLRVVTGLKERFVKYQNALSDKARELKRINTTNDKSDFAAASKNLVTSIALSTKLTGIMTNIEESLDVRRGWLIRKAIEACTKAISEQ